VGLGRLLGPSGVRASRIAERVTGTWGLGQGWVSHVTAALFLGTREGSSMRGEDLASLGSSAPLTSAGAVDTLIDAAVQAVAADHGVAVSKPSAGGAGGAVVDSAALDAFAQSVTGDEGVLATTARTLLDALGLAEKATVPADADDEAALSTESDPEAPSATSAPASASGSDPACVSASDSDFSGFSLMSYPSFRCAPRTPHWPQPATFRSITCAVTAPTIAPASTSVG